MVGPGLLHESPLRSVCAAGRSASHRRSAEHRHPRRARRQDEAHRAGAGRQEDRRRGRSVPERAGTGLEPELGTPRETPMNNRRRWLALYVLCAGELMIVLDTTIVNVALPSIRESL